MKEKFSTKSLMVDGTLILFAILTIWWIFLNPLSTDPNSDHSKYIWGSCYQIIAIWGGILGIKISNSYGGIKSLLGKSILFFSLGLLFQAFGQSVYSYYNLFANIQAPYPSLGDVGFFGSVILYIIGVLYLAKVSGVKFSLKSYIEKIQAFLIPIIILLLSYSLFLRGYMFDFSEKLKIILDFGYPLGQAFYVSIAILALIFSRKVLGGMMKKPILWFLFSLVIQYICDFNFLFQANNGTWYVGAYGDFLYMFSYLIMTLSIIKIGYTLKNIRASA
jgi:hypothetical protein